MEATLRTEKIDISELENAAAGQCERARSDGTVDCMHTIGRRLVVIGDVSSDEDLRIEGQVRGQVSVRGATLTIGAEAHVDADVRAARVVVLGHLRGSVAATERVELGASSSVDGDMHADQIVIGEGAHFTGNIDMGRRTLAARVAEYRAGRAAGAAAR